MSSTVCGECNEPITGEPPGLDPAQRKPCPNCGSTARIDTNPAQVLASLGSVTAHGDVVIYPRKLLMVARKLIDEGEYGIAVIVAHMACEIAAGRSLAEAFVARAFHIWRIQ
jgi:hypothetical protein